MNWPAYEQRKAAWMAANPGASCEQYEQAARRDFRGDKLRKASDGVAPRNEKRVLPAPAKRSPMAVHERQS